MNKRPMLLIVLLLLLPFALAACGGGDVSEDDAEKALKAAFEGDVDEANKYICDDDKIEEGDIAAIEGIEVDNIECKKDGDKMTCSYALVMEGIEGTTPGEVSIDIEDGKLCGDGISGGQ